jgi:hypothetical protein
MKICQLHFLFTVAQSEGIFIAIEFALEYAMRKFQENQE